MNLVACSLCSEPYRPTEDTHRSFCAPCVAKINQDARKAEAHMRRINAGDMRVAPDNERQRSTRDNERRRQLRGMS